MVEYTDEQLRKAVFAEYVWLCHDGLEEGDMTESEFEQHLSGLNREQLIREADVDTQHYTLDRFMHRWGDS